MATMYVYNIPTNETVNLRAQPSSDGKVLVRVGYGKAVQADYYNSTWHSATYSGNSGYIMSKFLTSTNPSGGGSSGGGSYLGTGTVIGGGPLYCRKQPIAGYAYWGQFQEGTTVQIYSCSTSGWYETRWPATGNNVGYVMSQYISMSGGSSGGGTTDNINVGDTVITILPGVNFRSSPSGTSLFQVSTGTTMVVTAITTSGGYTWYKGVISGSTGYLRGDCVEKHSGGSGGGTTTSYTFISKNAVTYALNHSENSSGVCSKRNTFFPTIDGNDDCADFVSQCLCAGGVPMFNGWFYNLAGIPTSWSNSKWGVTYSGYQRLSGKGWLQTVAYNAIQSGDIIYSYDPNATPTPYTHVTIAVSENVTDNGKFGCRVCGNTANQHDRFKELTSSNCRCYRVKGTLPGDGTEKRVSLPLDGNGANVL